MKYHLSAALISSILVGSTFAAATTTPPPSSAQSPYRLAYLGYAVTPEQVQIDSNGLALASAHVQSKVNAGVIDGAVLLVARHGKVVLHEAYGKRDGNFVGDPSTNPAMTTNAIFDLQSMTKLFTAFVAVELDAEGALDLSDPVSTYLPEFAIPEKSAVTVGDLVKATSGEPIDTDAFLVGDPEPWDTMLAQSLAYTPNTMVLYSDIGYRLLGRVLEIAGGASLDALVQARVFNKLGMNDTSWRPQTNMACKSSRFVGTGYSSLREADGSARYLRGETADDQDWWLETLAGSTTGCDGAFSTAWDMALFGQMFLNQGTRVLGTPDDGCCFPWMTTCQIDPLTPEPYLTAMMQLQTKDALGVPLGIEGATSSWLDDLLFANKGHGWELRDLDPGAHVVTGLYSSTSAVSKIGGAGTFITVDPDPDHDLVIVLLTNHGLPSFVGPDGIGVDANGNLIWPGYENMLNGIEPNVVNDIVQLSIFAP